MTHMATIILSFKFKKIFSQREVVPVCTNKFNLSACWGYFTPLIMPLDMSPSHTPISSSGSFGWATKWDLVCIILVHHHLHSLTNLWLTLEHTQTVFLLHLSGPCILSGQTKTFQILCNNDPPCLPQTSPLLSSINLTWNTAVKTVAETVVCIYCT